jgi:hypothetical protein
MISNVIGCPVEDVKLGMKSPSCSNSNRRRFGYRSLSRIPESNPVSRRGRH